MHANFLMNENHATATDMLTLIEQIRSRAQATRGVDLELEIKVW